MSILVKIINLTEKERDTLRDFNVAFNNAEKQLRGYESQLRRKYEQPCSFSESTLEYTFKDDKEQNTTHLLIEREPY